MLFLTLDFPLTTATVPQVEERARTERRAIVLVFCCTLLGAAAQVLMKIGMSYFVPSLWGVATNVPLVSGYALYGLSTLLLVIALREGELSILYPIIALSYVWVTLLSYTLLHEPSNVFKNAGILAIVAGVTVLGKAGKK